MELPFELPFVISVSVSFIIGTIIYFVPTIIAVLMRKRGTTGIVLLNLFAGWTIVGWVIALVWALVAKRDTG
jgi:uncharacterized protein YqhQ